MSQVTDGRYFPFLLIGFIDFRICFLLFRQGCENKRREFMWGGNELAVFSMSKYRRNKLMRSPLSSAFWESIKLAPRRAFVSTKVRHGFFRSSYVEER